ncbi:citryl-CoA lyase [Methylomonas sp. MED-D]|uniref:citryl-CoA lyase n=1 Tax=unclassified Methylomonas TaxID=2608980 RepID=UPI0028A34346|nr:citryl-CoA lyase [Methylomonas sp. MV1]MDT4330134.1 citryl-CoA lyase [Methylomonas sp. MV1]
MSADQTIPTIRTRIWREEAESDNRFATRTAYCRGYDVYGEMLGQARWTDLLYMLFMPEAPSAEQSALLDSLALALANPGPRDPAVHAAMCGGVCGSPAASSLMAALAVGAGQAGGAREVYNAANGWLRCGTDLNAWRRWLTESLTADPGSVWPAVEHPSGFDDHGAGTSLPVRQTLDCLAKYGVGPRLPWLIENLAALQALAGRPLALSGVAAAALADLGFDPEQSEMLYLLLRLPGAAAHALEQRPLGYKKFPFGVVELETPPVEQAA